METKKFDIKKFEKQIYPKYEQFLKKKKLKIDEINKKKKEDLEKEATYINFNKTFKKKINYKKECDFLSRINQFEKKKNQKIAIQTFNKQKKKNNQLENLTFKPSINNKIVFKRSIQDMLLWQKNSKLKKEKERKKKARSEIRRNKGKKNEGKKNEGKKVYYGERFYDIRLRPNKSMDLPVQERLYDYKKYYDLRKKNNLKKSVENLFKPELISRNNANYVNTDSKIDTYMVDRKLNKKRKKNYITKNIRKTNEIMLINEGFKLTDNLEKKFILNK